MSDSTQDKVRRCGVCNCHYTTDIACACPTSETKPMEIGFVFMDTWLIQSYNVPDDVIARGENSVISYAVDQFEVGGLQVLKAWVHNTRGVEIPHIIHIERGSAVYVKTYALTAVVTARDDGVDCVLMPTDPYFCERLDEELGTCELGCTWATYAEGEGE